MTIRNKAWGKDRTFHRHWRRFIRSFRPEKLLPDKNLWLHLEKDGQFTVRLGEKGSIVPDLSETDELVFRYLCLLYMYRFWYTLPDRSCVPTLQSPLVLQDFADRLDESVDVDALLRRAEEICGHSVFREP